MATFKVRFYGRFVYAESAAAPDQLTIFAIDPSKTAGLGALPHHVFLSVAQAYVSRDPTARRPDHTVVSAIDRVRTKVAEQGIWSLDNSHLRINGSGFSWKPESGVESIPDLGRLSGGRSLDLQSAAIVSDMTLTAGAALAESFSKTVPYSFVPYDAQNEPDLRFPDMALADRLEVEILASELAIEVRGRNGGDPTVIKIVSRKAREVVVVCLSNLCSGPPPHSVDHEFAALYEVVAGRPALGQRLVPKAMASPIFEVGCYTPAYVRY